ncbi:hypothetical protein [Altibacter lentus]|uniref:hypothetical protein n=1 Tax=Altibacter lentus TaxID=1223410 RepID=UPI0005515EB2|nr:hypothetical protein [Altibacter lentus]
MRQQRICIYHTDVSLLTGKGERSARRIIQSIKQHSGKNEHQAVTVCELSQYLGLDPLVVYKTINNLPLLEEWAGE